MPRIDDPILSHLNSWCALAFRKYDVVWYYDWKGIVGLLVYILMWFKWIRYGYTGWKYHEKGIFVFAFDLVLLHFAQYFRDRIMLGCLTMVALNMFGCAYVFKSPVHLERDGLKSQAVYDEVGRDFLQVCFIFTGQIMFAMFYYLSMTANFDENHINYLHWVAGFIAVQMTQYFNRGSRSQLGNVWNIETLYNLASLVSSGAKLHPPNDAVGKPQPAFTLSVMEVHVRNGMGSFINLFIRDLIAYSVPLMLTQFEDPINCVIYSIAVNFIVTLDDTDEALYQIEVTAPNDEIEVPAASRELLMSQA